MKLVTSLFSIIRKTLWSIGGLLSQLAFRPRFYQVETVEDLPDRLDKKILYVVAEGPVRTHAAMACPSGRCSETLNMNLLPDDYPVWALTVESDGRPSLRPSVWRKTSCGCHFWMERGDLHWC